MELKSVEDTSWLQLFIKNTALCKHESGRIRCDACPGPSRMELKSVEDTSWLQLFIKNTALCKHESGRIRCDACPVPEG
ncbi:hypothetical protein [Escherichia coli]|uniref:hypothetical protein n=1 Tax=Escherichia coli TaxID=562 RepID=UPI0029C4996F|nr:hypothetical protein [Escherichia coli]MDX5552174.1 hypothetical protein [Escherichia coli]